MRFIALTALLAALTAGTLSAQGAEQKGSFGVVISENFVKFNYVLSYLGESAQPDHVSFRISFDDTKGYNLAAEIDEAQTSLKNVRNQTISGKVERESASSAVLMFPKDESFALKGKIRFYTVIKGYKLNRSFDL